MPEFAHVSLLIGKDRQKLSKRHGATSVKQYREEGYLPEALANYLCLLGWSHPEERDVFTINEMAEVFDLKRFSKAHAIYDIDKLKYINSQHIKMMDEQSLFDRAGAYIAKDSFYHQQSKEWQQKFLNLYQEKIQLFPELNEYVAQLTSTELIMDDTLKEIFSWESTPQIKDYVTQELAEVSSEYLSEEILGEWMDYCKKELKIKGKPLFMGFRGVLTGQNHGPDLKPLIALTPVEVLKKRMASL